MGVDVAVEEPHTGVVHCTRTYREMKVKEMISQHLRGQTSPSERTSLKTIRSCAVQYCNVSCECQSWICIRAVHRYSAMTCSTTSVHYHASVIVKSHYCIVLHQQSGWRNHPSGKMATVSRKGGSLKLRLLWSLLWNVPKP